MNQYILPNNKLVDTEMIFIAMEDSNLVNEYFLDSETGEVEIIFDAEEDREKHLEQMENKRYIAIDRIPSYEFYNCMDEFVRVVVGSEDKNLEERLLIALDGKGAFRRFKDVISNAGEWPNRWYKWKDNYLENELKEWLTTLPVKIQEVERVDKK